MRFPKKHYTREQKAWCENYIRHAGFEPLMCDYEAGYETFVEAAKKSVKWFEEWSTEAHRNIDDEPVPGDLYAFQEAA